MPRIKVMFLLLAVLAGVCCVALNRSSATDDDGGGSADKGQKKVAAQKSDDKSKQAARDDDEPILNEFMHQKLDATSNILEGLMTENFDLIEKNAKKLLEMSHAESWRASNDMMYLQHSTQFRTTVKELLDEAKADSIDGASLEWVQVTMSCMQCHKWVRNIMLAGSLDAPQRAPQFSPRLSLK